MVPVTSTVIACTTDTATNSIATVVVITVGTTNAAAITAASTAAGIFMYKLTFHLILTAKASYVSVFRCACTRTAISDSTVGYITVSWIN